jgi:23S rRNA (pseudouridine1915-N3)-methyltransferase
VIFAVGKMKPPFVDDVAHYEKLLSRYTRLDIVEVDDADKIQARLPERAHVVLLDAEGKARDSVGLSRWLETRRQSGRDLALVIGGAYGVSLSQPDELLSFGPITLPYQLCRVVLLEQLFRAHKILAGEPYHH